jgi:putative membrane protein
MEPVSIAASLAGITKFLFYFLSCLVFLGIFKGIYPLITPHKEWHLVKEERNAAAATAFTGAFVGFSIALGSAAANSVAYFDFIIWALVALVAQVIAYFMVHFMLAGISERIQKQELSAGIFAGGTSIAVGILNASCMTY